MTDIQAKYQKLASEYSKLKSQLPVLKKAVLDEQAKEGELQDALKEKEQSLRKYDQEVESLTFRNQQLSARVEVLQKELETLSRLKKVNTKGRGATTPTSPSDEELTQSVMGQELTSKIEENARLHKQVHEVELSYRQEVGELQEKLMLVEEEAGRHQQVLDDTKHNLTAQIDKLQDEKVTLQVKLQNQETQCREACHKLQTAEETLAKMESELTGRLSDATTIIHEKIPFNDSVSKHLSSLNIPSHNRRHCLRAMELVNQAAGLIKDLTQALSNLYTYWQQRVRLYPADVDLGETLSSSNKKLVNHLQENAVVLRQVEQSFRTFADSMKDDSITSLETAIGLQDFSEAWKSSVLYATKLTPYILLGVQEESSMLSCSEHLERKNNDFQNCWHLFIASLSKLDTYIALLASYSTSQCDQPTTSQPAIFRLLTGASCHFHDVVKDLSKCFNAKISLEHQQPTATQKLKITDECIVSALISLVTCSSKMSTFLQGNSDFLCQPSTPSVPCHPLVSDYRQRAVAYIASLNRPVPESVPHDTAVQNRQMLFSSTESRDSLAGQVVALQEKVHKLEADKEHWMLEAQLQQVKYDKQTKFVQEQEQLTKQLQARLSGSSTSVPHVDNNHKIAPTSSNDSSKDIHTSMLGELSEIADIASEESIAREELIKKHFQQRISQLTLQLQQAESKALHFHAECRALHKRLSLAQKERNNFECDLETANQTIAQLKDELQTTTRSYEGQLSMMSEHLAGMNEKLTTQKDEIDELKYQLGNKGEKKSIFSRDSDKKAKKK